MSRRPGQPLRVVQFNLLADGLSGMHKEKGGFTESPEGSLDWEYRRGRILEEMFRHFEPDIVACQEVDHYEWLATEMLERGLSGKFVAKPNSPCSNPRISLDPTLKDGSALFWRTSAVELRADHTINYEALTAEGEPTGKPSNQVGLIALLEHRASGKPFVVAVSHLMAKKTWEGERVRCQQVQQLLCKVDDVASAAAVETTITCMDMNASPCASGAAAYKPEAYPAALSTGMRSAYAVVLGDEPAYTTYKIRGAYEAKHTIDYILISPSVGVRRVLLPPEEADIDSSALPGWRYPSDHIALMAELLI